MSGAGDDNPMTSKEIEQAMAEALEAVEKQQAQAQLDPSNENMPTLDLDDLEVETEITQEPEIIEASSSTNEAPQEAAKADDAGETQGEEFKAQLIRMAADFENFKKRARKEKEDLRKFGNEHLMRDILPVLDNLERALAHVDSDANPLVEGIKMVSKQFLQVMENYGVRPIESTGKTFDPAIHDAMTQQPTADAEPGTVLQEFERGFTIHERLLRPAKVIVAAAMPQAEPAPEPEAEEETSES